MLQLVQMLTCDQDVLAAFTMQVDSSMSSSSSSSSSASRSVPSSDLRRALKPRMSRLKKLVMQADQLRLNTLHQLFLVLTPVQVARCAIAAFELAFMVREMGNSAQSRTLRTPHPPTPAAESSNVSSDSSPLWSDALSDLLTDSLQISQPSPSCSSQDSSTSVELERISDDD